MRNLCSFWVSNRTPSAHSEPDVSEKQLGERGSVLDTRARIFSVFPVHSKHVQTSQTCCSSSKSPLARDASCPSDWESRISLQHVCASNGTPTSRGIHTLAADAAYRGTQSWARGLPLLPPGCDPVALCSRVPRLCPVPVSSGRDGPTPPHPPNVSTPLDHLFGPLLSSPHRSQPPPHPV